MTFEQTVTQVLRMSLGKDDNSILGFIHHKKTVSQPRRSFAPEEVKMFEPSPESPAQQLFLEVFKDFQEDIRAIHEGKVRFDQQIDLLEHIDKRTRRLSQLALATLPPGASKRERRLLYAPVMQAALPLEYETFCAIHPGYLEPVMRAYQIAGSEEEFGRVYQREFRRFEKDYHENVVRQGLAIPNSSGHTTPTLSVEQVREFELLRGVFMNVFNTLAPQKFRVTW